MTRRRGGAEARERKLTAETRRRGEEGLKGFSLSAGRIIVPEVRARRKRRKPEAPEERGGQRMAEAVESVNLRADLRDSASRKLRADLRSRRVSRWSPNGFAFWSEQGPDAEARRQEREKTHRRGAETRRRRAKGVQSVCRAYYRSRGSGAEEAEKTGGAGRTRSAADGFRGVGLRPAMPAFLRAFAEMPPRMAAWQAGGSLQGNVRGIERRPLSP